MPPDYHFGLTAASADTADSFEVYGFQLYTSKSITREEPSPRGQPPPGEGSNSQNNALPPPAYSQSDLMASQKSQFEDLHRRLQGMAIVMDSLFQEVKQLAEKSEGRHQELSRNVMPADRLNGMDQRLQGIEKTVRDYQGQFSNLQVIMKDSHSSLVEGLPKHMGDSRLSPPPSSTHPQLLTSTSHNN